MSYDFWVDINAAGDLGSGCTQDLTPAWSGTVTVSGSTVTKVSGPDFPEAMRDGTHFLRIDPDGTGDSNVRVISGGVSSLTIAGAMTVGTAIDAYIGGAFKSPEAAIGYYNGLFSLNKASKVPYADGDGIDDAINIFIAFGTYNLTHGLSIESATQNTQLIRRRIRGLSASGDLAGFVNGVFNGPTLDCNVYDEDTIRVNASSITITGLNLKSNTSRSCVRSLSGNYNLVVDSSLFSYGQHGFNCLSDSSSNVIECRFNNLLGGGIIGFNTSAERCVAVGCGYPWGGFLSSYIDCIESDSTAYCAYIGDYPGSIDFSYCWFRSDKPMYTKTGSQGRFSHCVFDYDRDISESLSDLQNWNCVVGGQFVGQTDHKYIAVPEKNYVIDNAGVNTFAGIYEPACNMVSHYPDPTLDRYCRFSTAGTHEYRFPVEAVGARALRNRTRVSNSEIGL